MRVFVTGITGYVGSHLLPALAASPHDVTCLVRTQEKANRVRTYGVTAVLGDVTDRASLRAAMPGHDVVLHAANVYSYWEPDPSVYMRVNAEGTRNVLETALEIGAQRVIYLSSTMIYGGNSGKMINEETPPATDLPGEYARSKAAGDAIAWDLRRMRGLPLVSIYPSGITGPGDTKVMGKMMQDFLARRLPALVTPDTEVSSVDIGDVVHVLLRAMDHPGIEGERFMVSNKPEKMRNLYQMAHEITGAPLPSITLPNGVYLAAANMLTAIANLTKREPMSGMAADFARFMQQGQRVDGSKAARTFGFTYRPIRDTLADLAASLRKTG